VLLLRKKFNLNTLNVGDAYFHNNNNNVELVVLLVVVPVAAVVPVAEASVVVLVTVAVAVAVLSGSNSHISSNVGILWEAVLHVFAVCSALGTRCA
jgi:hypothetical protein